MPTLTLPDGRALCWDEQGDPAGSPVLTFHGGFASRLSRYPFGDVLASHGVRQISADRPGYGGSSACEGRSVADVAADMRLLLDALGVQQVGLLGGSAGGPHALATAALLPERVSRVVVTASLAPRELLPHRYFDGMLPANATALAAAAFGRERCAALVEQVEQVRAQAVRGVDAVLAGLGVDQRERERAAELGPWMLEGVVEGLRPGPWGWVDDCIALARPWGFDPARITCSVLFEHGRADRNVPISHGRALAAAIPHARLVEHDDEGHVPDPAGMLRRVLVTAGQD